MGNTTHRELEVTVALQGTLDTFALPDVLRLLAATKKSGRLRITGTRGAGSVWVTGGEISAVEATHAPHASEVLDALFELLRFQDGSFTFDADVAPESPGPATDVEQLLEQAESLLTEWRQIEAVVPSLDAYVTLRRTLDAPTLTIAQEQWSTLVAVGGGSTVRRVADELCLAEIPVSRAVRDLAELGVIDIAAGNPAGGGDGRVLPSAPTAEAGPAKATLLVPDPSIALDAPVPAPPSEAESPSPDLPDAVAASAEPEALPVARPLRARRSKASAPVAEGPKEPERFVPLELPAHMTASRPPQEPTEDEAVEGVEDVEVDDLAAAFPGLANRSIATAEDEELARQLATLSPKAASAIRAAAEAATEEERDAALDEAAAGEDGPINRGLLLKFLSSVKG